MRACLRPVQRMARDALCASRVWDAAEPEVIYALQRTSLRTSLRPPARRRALLESVSSEGTRVVSLASDEDEHGAGGRARSLQESTTHLAPDDDPSCGFLKPYDLRVFTLFAFRLLYYVFRV